MDGRKIGLPDVRETLGIRAKCVWSFPCLEDPAVCAGGPGNGGDDKYPMCVQKGTQGFECRCQDGICGGSSSSSGITNDAMEEEEWDQVKRKRFLVPFSQGSLKLFMVICR